MLDCFDQDLDTVSDSHLLHHLHEALLDRRLGDKEFLGHLPIAHSLRQETNDLHLLLGEFIEEVLVRWHDCGNGLL